MLERNQKQKEKKNKRKTHRAPNNKTKKKLEKRRERRPTDQKEEGISSYNFEWGEGILSMVIL